MGLKIPKVEQFFLLMEENNFIYEFFYLINIYEIFIKII